MKIIVTGGAGFIGSAVIRKLLNQPDVKILNLDSLTYAGNLDSIPLKLIHSNYHHAAIDICNYADVTKLIEDFQPNAIMHLAAESHVDRSIESPESFLQTNIMGTYHLLEASRQYLNKTGNRNFIFHHISTDEVYGDLGPNSTAKFTESSRYDPSSPYSASKASADHLVRAWGRTYDLPFVITNCSNNYGPYQFPEKLIPNVILNCLHGRDISVYGNGSQIRDWLYVEDHADALIHVVHKVSIGETYNIGGNNEKTNLQVVHAICDLLDELSPSNFKNISSYHQLIKFVQDRPGHDSRYSIDASKIMCELDWEPKETFESGIAKTVSWYLSHLKWSERIFSGEYALDRMGLLATTNHYSEK